MYVHLASRNYVIKYDKTNGDRFYLYWKPNIEIVKTCYVRITYCILKQNYLWHFTKYILIVRFYYNVFCAVLQKIYGK